MGVTSTMFNTIKIVGGWLQSLRGWIFAFTAAPTVIALVTSWLEPLSWTHRLLVVLAVLALSLNIACAAIVLFRLSSDYFASRKEQQRIAAQLNEVIASGVSNLDTPTVAAIWSGSREEANVFRHLKFRTLKAAMRSGDVKWVKRPDESKPSIKSSIKVSDLVAYFIQKGVLDQADIKAAVEPSFE
jgi:hypothetical protein